MRWKIALITAIVLGAVGGPWIKNLPGLVIIAYQKTSYEMRLWVAIAILFFLFLLMYFLITFLKGLLSSMTKVKGWQGGRKWRRARKQTIEGMRAFVEGNWNKSEKAMISAVRDSDSKLINYLIAAQAAQHQKAVERRDQYLRLADRAEPNAKTAVGLTQAQLQIDNHQYEQALATLNGLPNKTNHPFILKLLYLTHQYLQDWKAIVELLPQLGKLKVLEDSALEQLEISSIAGLLKLAAEKNQLKGLQNEWASLPVSSRKNADNILNYCHLLIAFDQMNEAEKLLKPLLKKNPTKAIIQTYGEISSTDISKQFTLLENWYSNNPKAPNAIFLALGKIAYNASLWGKARFYFERSLRVAPSAMGYLLMAKTLEKIEDVELASESYRKGLELMLDVNPTQK